MDSNYDVVKTLFQNIFLLIRLGVANFADIIEILRHSWFDYYITNACFLFYALVVLTNTDVKPDYESETLSQISSSNKGSIPSCSMYDAFCWAIVKASQIWPSENILEQQLYHRSQVGQYNQVAAAVSTLSSIPTLIFAWWFTRRNLVLLEHVEYTCPI